MKVYKAELAEKILVSGDEISDPDSFQLGGKVLFNDLSVLKYIHNLNFIEKQIPKGVMEFEYINSITTQKTDDSKTLLEGLKNKKIEGGVLNRGLRIIPYPQDRAESDLSSIVFFHNGESAVESFDGKDYRIYDKQATDNFFSAYNLDGNLINRKLQKDMNMDNNPKEIKKFKI